MGYKRGQTKRTLQQAGSQQLSNALLWDVILALSPKIDGKIGVLRGRFPVVRFKGRYYLVAQGNPWPTFRHVCRLVARRDDDRGDLAITSDGLVASWITQGLKRRGVRKPTIYGVQDDIEPVTVLPKG